MANAGNGIEVTGGTAAGPNVITGNKVGDRGKGNGDHGILIQHDQGNGTADPVELEDNVVRANGGKGIFVAGVDATGHELQRNVSGGSGDQVNGECAFDVIFGNFNSKDNKANNKLVKPNTNGAPFPEGCLK